MSLNINAQYNTSSYTTSGKTKNVSEYSKYLTNKFPCLSPGKGISITIAPSLLRKAMGNEKTAKWLEENLAVMPDVIKRGHSMASAHGERIVSESWEFSDDGVISSSVLVETDSEPNTEVDEWLEKIKEKKEEQKKAGQKVYIQSQCREVMQKSCWKNLRKPYPEQILIWKWKYYRIVLM